MISRIIAEDIHVEAGALLDHGQPNPSRADNRDRLTGYLITQERKKRMPRWPPLLAHEALARVHLARQHAHHEKGKLSRRFGENIGGMRKWNFVSVGICSVDVVKAHRDLGDDLE